MHQNPRWLGSHGFQDFKMPLNPNAFMLGGYMSVVDYFDTLKIKNVDYQVPADSSFCLHGIIVHTNKTAQTSSTIIVGYGDDAVTDSAVEPSNYVELEKQYYIGGGNNVGSDVHHFMLINSTIPEGKFPCIQGVGSFLSYTIHAFLTEL